MALLGRTEPEPALVSPIRRACRHRFTRRVAIALLAIGVGSFALSLWLVGPECCCAGWSCRRWQQAGSFATRRPRAGA
ncbi:hypothetical protein ACU4GD_03715 [Cupriavidus basilensis]